MLTRDSNALWLVMLAGIIGVLASDAQMVRDLAPDAYETQFNALVKLLSMVLLGGGGLARMSWLPLSPEGRRDQLEKKAIQMDAANIVAAVASEKADIAVQATTIAASAAQMAKDITKEADK